MGTENFEETLFHVGRDSRQLGEFSGRELVKGLESGEFRTTDLVWREGMPDWEPLGSVLVLNRKEFVRSQEEAVVKSLEVAPPQKQVKVGEVVDHTMRSRPAPVSATVSLVLGLIPFLFCPIGFLSSVPGVICGHIGLKSIREGSEHYGGKGVAIAGLILNYFWLCMVALVILLFMVDLVTVEPATE